MNKKRKIYLAVLVAAITIIAHVIFRNKITMCVMVFGNSPWFYLSTKDSIGIKKAKEKYFKK